MLKYLNLLVLWNYFVSNLSIIITKLTGRLFFFGNPSAVSIEPSSVCNLACPECPVGNGSINTRDSFLENDFFERIIQGLPRSVVYLNLYFQGEPFMDHGLMEKVRIAKRRKIYTEISTNGHFLNKESVKEIVDAEPDRIIVSLDGIDADTYNLYRKNGDFNAVINGVKLLAEERKNSKKRRPIIVLQMLVFKYNENQFKQYRNLCKELGADRVKFKSVQFYDKGNIEKMQSSKNAYARYYIHESAVLQKRKIPRCCNRLWMHPVITTKGDVLPCCYDKSGNIIMGNLHVSSFKEIWRSAAFMDIRRDMLKKKYPPICKNCGG